MSDIYDADILSWSEQQAALLRQVAAGERVNEADLDWLNIIERSRAWDASNCMLSRRICCRGAGPHAEGRGVAVVAVGARLEGRGAAVSVAGDAPIRAFHAAA
ncbi:MAG: DUF29 domain-containing protein, partial [Pseudomonadota bacterium]|nr:DUF29 domain-containing protein [Pseudomonadota bacterium]